MGRGVDLADMLDGHVGFGLIELEFHGGENFRKQAVKSSGRGAFACTGFPVTG